MGNQNYRTKLYEAIERSKAERIVQILQKCPTILEEDLSNDVRVTPLARAVWRNDFEITDLLLKVK